LWLNLLKLALTFAAALVGYLKQRQLLEAGRADAIAEALRNADGEIKGAQEARQSVRDSIRRDPGKLREPDEFTRD
jgi:hypothetical protein